MTGTRYERITAKTDDGHVTYRCEIISESEHILRAHILDSEWNRGGTFNEDGVEVWTEWLLDKSLITKRVPMRENLTYGTWEPIPKGERCPT